MISEGDHSPKGNHKTQARHNQKKGCVITLSITLVIMLGLFFIIPSDNQEQDPKVIAQADPIPFPPSSPDIRAEQYGNPDVKPEPADVIPDEDELECSSKPDRGKREVGRSGDEATSPNDNPSMPRSPSNPAHVNRKLAPSLTLKEVERIIISGKPSNKIPDETIIAVNGEKMNYRSFRIGVSEKILTDIKVTSIIDNETIVVTASIKHKDLERLRQETDISHE